jgi:ADP-heptose:LPS heptosyltransferase
VNIHSLMELAAAIAAFDFVITSDSIAAHIAGALAKPGFVLVPAGCPWYWRAEQGRSVWYPSLEIIPQNRAGDWSNAIDCLRARLGRARQPEDRADQGLERQPS